MQATEFVLNGPLMPHAVSMTGRLAKTLVTSARAPPRDSRDRIRRDQYRQKTGIIQELQGAQTGSGYGLCAPDAGASPRPYFVFTSPGSRLDWVEGQGGQAFEELRHIIRAMSRGQGNAEPRRAHRHGWGAHGRDQ